MKEGLEQKPEGEEADEVPKPEEEKASTGKFGEGEGSE